MKKLLSAGLAAGLIALAAPAQPALPLCFEAAPSSAGGAAQFVAHQRDSQFLISQTGAQIILQKNGAGLATVQIQFTGANPQAQIHGEVELSGKINYLVGSDPAQWRSGVPTFAKVNVEQIYPGINLVYYGNQQQLEYDFNLAPGANPAAIKIQFGGAEKISTTENGELVLTLRDGEIRQPRPVIYQAVNGARREISGGYKILDARTVAFNVGNYDRALPLVIDPVLGYSTYFGGNYGETAWAVALDGSNNIYVAGQTLSTRFTNNLVPFSFSTPGAFQTNYLGQVLGTAFVAKFDNSGSNLIYLTYLGGTNFSAAYGLAVDGAGHAFVAGATDSTNFPVKNAVTNGTFNGAKITGVVDPHDTRKLFPTDAFVTELETNGASLVYSTYLGGESYESANSIAVDAAGNAYVTGYTYSTNFPTTPNARFNHLLCANSFYVNANAFVAEITNGGGLLVYSSYLGGTNFDQGQGIAVDANNFVYVAGYTASTNFPAVNYLHQMIGSNLVDGHFLNGETNQKPPFSYDAFVAKFYPACTNLVYCTLLGSTNNDRAYGIACDNAGGAYVVGETTSQHFPDTAGSIIRNGVTNSTRFGFAIVTNAFLTKITNGPSETGTNTGIAYSALFGGTNINVGWKVALDPANDAFVVGWTSSTNFPTANTFGSLRATNSGGNDVFVTAFNSDCTAVLYSGLLGGKTNDFGYGIAVDANSSAYIVGQTLSTNFPTFNASQTRRNGTNDAFLARIDLASLIVTLAANLSGTNFDVTWPPTGQATTNFLRLESSTNLVSTNWVLVPELPVLTNNLGTNLYDYKINPTNRTEFFRLHSY